MSMISFFCFGLVAVVFFLLWLLNRYEKVAEKNIRIRNWILLLASFCFMTVADWRFSIILLGVSISTYFFSQKRSLCKYGILIAVLSLAFFKYFQFFVDSFTQLLNVDGYALQLFLPLGISFYVFSAISYLADVAKGKVQPQKFVQVSLYLSFFPKIISGPIQKSADFFQQIEEKKEIGWNSFSEGIQIIVFGIFKKMVLADWLSIFVYQVYETPLAFGSFTVFLATIAYSFQIYFDFSGYSDIAIGISRMLGIQMPRNFNLPYLAHNVTEFWKRWHITLSSWLQEYVYFPLGGNRKGKGRTYVNLLATMVIGGIWHGANWTFVIWGFLHGLALVIHKIWMKWTQSDTKQHTAFSNVVCILFTFLFVSFCWIFFRADSFNQAILIIGRIFAFEKGLEQPFVWVFVSIIVLLGAGLVAFVHTKNQRNLPDNRKQNVCRIEGYYPILDLHSFWGLVIFFVVCGLIICLAYTGGSPFIYGNF